MLRVAASRVPPPGIKVKGGGQLFSGRGPLIMGVGVGKRYYTGSQTISIHATHRYTSNDYGNCLTLVSEKIHQYICLTNNDCDSYSITR